MSDKKQHEEEYQFPADEYVEKPEHQAQETTEVDEQPEVAAVNKPRFGGIKKHFTGKRKAVLLIIVVVAAGVAFKFMTDSNKTPAAAPQPVVQAPTVAQPNPQVESQLADLKQTLADNQQKFNALQDQVDNMQTALSQANSSYQTLNTNLQALMQQLKKAPTPPKKAAATKKPAKAIIPIVFHIKAIVPGRAWVFNNLGQAETISVGDSLPQYGQINAINANTGVVTTSSGKLIEYGVDDF